MILPVSPPAKTNPFCLSPLPFPHQIYIPRVPGLPADYAYHPTDFGLLYEDAHFVAEDGIALHGWLMWPREWGNHPLSHRPVVVFFQENAGNMSFRLPFLKELTRALNCSAFALSYRGYGISKGSPSEKGLRIDAMAALHWLQQRGDTGPVIVMGRSLGGAVALRAASDCILASKITTTSTTTNNNIELKGLIIENTFSTMAATVGHIMPFLSPLIGPGKFGNFLLRNKWDNVESAKELTNFPILWLSSLQDEMLPPVHMSELFSLHPKEPWKFVTFENGRHIDTYESHAAQYWPIVKGFVDAQLSIRTGGGPPSQQAPQDGEEEEEDVDEGWVAVSDKSKKEL
jgi:fermentation-respiration switch protein FrsA (DUF1100 family)